MNRYRIFVYGTLMSGQGNHRRMEGAYLLGPAELYGFELRNVGAFPAIVSGKGYVRGEVYSVTLEHRDALDRFEGCPRLYRRELVVLADGRPACAYVFASDARRYPKIVSGDWRQRETRAS